MDTSRLLSRRRFLVLGTGSAAIVAGVLPASGLLQSAFAQEGAVRYCSTNGVRLRSGPGLSYRIVSTLSAGTRVTVIGQARPANGFEWTRVTMSVQSDILEGYVASQFVSRTVAAEPDPRFPIGSAFFVDAGRGRANLRDVPGTESRVVRTVVSGTRGKILDDPIKASGLRWFNVEIEGKFGYLVDDVMIPASPGIEGPGFEAWPVGSNVVVSDGPLNLRDKPYGKSLGTYATGSRATTTARAALLANGNHVIWYPVRTGRGQQGWFAADFLELV